MNWIKWTEKIDTDDFEPAEEFLVFGYPLFNGSKTNAHIFQSFWNGQHFVTHYELPKELIPIYFIRIDDIPWPDLKEKE